MTEPTKSFQVLLTDRVREITRNARSTGNRQHMAWFRDGSKMAVLAKALKHKADTVILDGQPFVIRYKGDDAVVKPADGSFIPCAYINVQVYLAEWEAHERATHVTRLGDSN